ncbi:Sulfotransferase domain superfamily [Coleofasciculus chthonoplastes PCC 7420]|uniref:Sulfotransferase domain superfamily n=1 Tax=Coleofasciculus chthonoplastes PCC 7420 TaxID=118168 RepID=B4VTG6_9CYAN|nr:sulfotransferase [Coleofasciculus chthonoplastes]EDX74552.1 Sulfotransferase domain superfamily [Coleofasciculus chthonoplastes PCC 7420]
MKLNFIIIGAQKSGSTFVQEILSEHPEVFMVPKERPFFEDPDYGKMDFQEFEKLFAEVTTEKAVGMKRPSYYGKFEVPERLYRHFPNIKLILVLRNPIERSISAYYHYMKDGFIPVKNIEEGMVKIINGEYKNTYKRANEIIEFSFYYKHIMHYLKYFNINQIHITLFDNLKKDTLAEISSIFKFLEIDPNYKPKYLDKRPQSGVYSLHSIKIFRLKNYFIYTYNQDRTRVVPKKSNIW